jgi:uncharacterized membrane protein YbaN (DUF454 family)
VLRIRRPADDDSPVRIRAREGSIRVEAAALFSVRGNADLENLMTRLFQVPAVQSIDIDRRNWTIAIDYDPRCLPVERALQSFSDALQGPAMESPLERLLHQSRGLVRRVDRQPGRVGDAFVIGIDGIDSTLPITLRDTQSLHERVRRLVNLGLGCGCFVMSIVGIMTPIVPTMPFVLATGYFLANSSPTLHELFRRSPLFGEMLTDWEERGGWRTTTKLKLYGLMVFLWGVTLVIAGFSWPLVITMGLVSSISIITIARVPTISDAGSPTKLLPAPA